jgi:hypothetical protein
MIKKELPLKATITRLLSIEFGNTCLVTCPDNQITFTMTGNSCQQNFGETLQQIHRVIDECCPERHENVFILVRDEAGSFQNLMKIWKSA